MDRWIDIWINGSIDEWMNDRGTDACMDGQPAR
jgi:hypothetical protein